MLPLPDRPTDALRLADWLELRALLAGDSNSSMGDLERTLARAGHFEDQPDAMDSKLADVSKELAMRSACAGAGYPFTIHDGIVEVQDWWRHSSYVFCLCLSYVSWRQPAGARTFPARIFETLSAEAARVFASAADRGASAIRFGAPRVPQEMPSNFKAAVNRLCIVHIGEGEGWRTGKQCTATLRGQDGGLDVVAWRDWPDSRTSKFLLWGACATGDDWEDKTHDLIVREFADEWLNAAPITPVVRAFFIPHRVHPDRWSRVCREAGVMFERCRIASLVRDLPGATQVHGNAQEWIDNVLTDLHGQ